MPEWTRFRSFEEPLLSPRRAPRIRFGSEQLSKSRAAAELVLETPSRRVVRTALAPTLFCFVLMSDRAFEQRLLAMQHYHGLGIFACNGWQIFSNGSGNAVPWLEQDQPVKFSTFFLNSSITAEFHSGSVQNTPLFLSIWRRIFREKRYLRFDFTVKLDLDTVFFPDQLRQVLRRHCKGQFCEADMVHFRQNLTHCFRDQPWRIRHFAPIMMDHAAMLGPIEVISRRGVAKFARYFFVCKAEYAQALRRDIFGDLWSEHEDVFVDRCMTRIGIKARVEHHLLQHMWNKGASVPYCTPGVVAYHPYKTVERHLRCYSQASMRDVAGGLRRCSNFGFDRGVPPSCPRPSVMQLQKLR